MVRQVQFTLTCGCSMILTDLVKTGNVFTPQMLTLGIKFSIPLYVYHTVVEMSHEFHLGFMLRRD